MDESKNAREPQMTEVKAKALLQSASQEGQHDSVPPRTSSMDARPVPKGPKDQPVRTQSVEVRSDAPPKPNFKDIPSAPRAPIPTSDHPEARQGRPRSSSVDESARNKGMGLDPNAIGIMTADDFLLIERPPTAHIKPTSTAGEGQSLLNRLTGSRRPDPSTWPPEALMELQRRDDLYHQMKAYINRLEERIQSQDQEISALNTALADAEHKLDLTRQDLNASRAFVSSEGTQDAQHLIKSLREINSGVDDFAFRLMQEVLPDAAMSRQVTKAGLEGLGKQFHGASRISSFINVAYAKRVTVGDFVHPFICYALCQRLLDLVFQPFVPGLDRETSEIFQAIYQMVHQNEPQERSARWRAITYSHAYRRRNDKVFCEKAADDFLSQMASAFTPLIEPEAITFEQLKTELGDVVRGIFEDAVKLQDKARMGYMSFDYSPFMPPLDQPFHPMYMETAQDVRQGGKGKGSMAILSIGLGMQAWKSVVKEDKAMGKDVSIAVKAIVICGNWNPNA